MTIWLIDIEVHEQRYTKEWRDFLPERLERECERRIGAPVEVKVVSGDKGEQQTTPGAFLNFAGTNIYKSSQIIRVAEAFERGEVVAGDKFLITDAWHPGIIQIRYMSDLLRIPVEIHALWHAGSYDPWDFLGRDISNKRWSLTFEKALFYAIDRNYFATDFHIRLFKEALEIEDDDKIVRTGWPMEYLADRLAPYAQREKRDLILFPHRLAPEKQVEIFKDLSPRFPDIEFRVCQETSLNKDEYHRLLGEALLVFSANQQETLGIGLYEGVICGAMPLAPKRLSYVEMYDDDWLYPSEWTENWDAYEANRDRLVDRIRSMTDWQKRQPREISRHLKDLQDRLKARFFSAEELFAKLA